MLGLVFVAEIGDDVTGFTRPQQLCSWAHDPTTRTARPGSVLAGASGTGAGWRATRLPAPVWTSREDYRDVGHRHPCRERGRYVRGALLHFAGAARWSRSSAAGRSRSSSPVRYS